MGCLAGAGAVSLWRDAATIWQPPRKGTREVNRPTAPFSPLHLLPGLPVVPNSKTEGPGTHPYRPSCLPSYLLLWSPPRPLSQLAGRSPGTPSPLHLFSAFHDHSLSREFPSLLLGLEKCYVFIRSSPKYPCLLQSFLPPVRLPYS